jgi:aminoglycoside 6'-N-acetyltransferase I
MEYEIIDFPAENQECINQTAALLYDSFKQDHPQAWPTMEKALQEVREALRAENVNKIALRNNQVIGWVGGIPQYNGISWELHPLVVDREYRGRGVGAKLVACLEQEIKKRGGINIYLGTDDENYQTSLAGVDLYPGVIDKIKRIKNLKNHPYEFYKRMGFEIIGILPDANGFGKPDIYMAKRINGLHFCKED